MQAYSYSPIQQHLHNEPTSPPAQLLVPSPSPPQFKGTRCSKFVCSVGLASEVRFSHFNASSSLLGHNFPRFLTHIPGSWFRPPHVPFILHPFPASLRSGCPFSQTLFSPHLVSRSRGAAGVWGRGRGRAAGPAGPGAAAPPVGAGSGRPGEAVPAAPRPPAAACCPRCRPALRWGCRRHGGVPGAPAGRAARQREGDRGPGPLLLQRGAAPSPGGAGDPRRGRVPGGAEEGAAPRFPLRPGAAGPAGRLAGLRRPPGVRQGGAGARRRDPLAGLLARVLGHRGAPAGLGLDRQDLLPRHQPGVPLHAPAQGGERAAPEGSGAGDDPAGAEGTARPGRACPGPRGWLGPWGGKSRSALPVRWSAPTRQGSPCASLPVVLRFAKADAYDGVKLLHTPSTSLPSVGVLYPWFALSCPGLIPRFRGRQVMMLFQPPLPGVYRYPKLKVEQRVRLWDGVFRVYFLWSQHRLA